MRYDEIKNIADVSDSAVDKQVYAFDATEHEGRTGAVVWPENTGDVIKIMKLASKRNIPVTVRGGGTSLAAGAVPGVALAAAGLCVAQPAAARYLDCRRRSRV